MPELSDAEFQAIAERLRSQADTPQIAALVEDVLEHIKRSDTYYTALGKFVSEFSRVETTLHGSLTIFAGVKNPVARAIFGGLKVEGHLQLIKRIADSKDWTPLKKEKLEEIINHLGPINKLRNDILHYGASMDRSTEDAWLVTNKDYVHIADKVRELSVTPKLLEDVCADLRKIFHLIIVLSFYDMSETDGASLEGHFSEFLAPAWRYKSPQPAMKAGKSRQTHPKRRRRHRASPS